MKNILIVGCGNVGLMAAQKLSKEGIETELISDYEATERGLTIKTVEPKEIEMTLINPSREIFTPPITRKQRRKNKRKK